MITSEVRPAPGSKERSRIQLLRDQGKAATGGWTTSSIHAPSSNEVGFKMMQEALQRQEHIETNLREQVGVLETEVGLLRGGARPPSTMPAGPAPIMMYGPPQPAGAPPQQQQQTMPFPSQQQQQQPQYPPPMGAAGGYPPSMAGPPPPSQMPAYYANPNGMMPPPPQGQQFQQQQQQFQYNPSGALPAMPGYPPGGYGATSPPTTPFIGPNTHVSTLSAERTRGKNSSNGKRSNSPVAAVETHQSNLLQQLQHQSQQSQSEAYKANLMLKERDQRELHMQQELHQLRLAAAQERDAANKSKNESAGIQATHVMTLSAQADLQVKCDNLQSRFSLVEKELLFVKNELEQTRRQPAYVSPSMRVERDGYSANAPDQSATSLAAHVEALKAELGEARQQITHRDQQIENMSHTIRARTDETEQLTARVRHEEQRLTLALSNTESSRVLLTDAQSEVEYLRLLTGEQHNTIERLTRELDERYQKVKLEMEARQVRELQCTNAVENVRHIHNETQKVHMALVAEQSINENLQLEVASLRTQLDDAKRSNVQLRESHDHLARQLKGVEQHFGSQAEQLEQCLGDWHKNLARQASVERGQIEACASVIQKLKSVTSSSSTGSGGSETLPMAPAQHDFSSSSGPQPAAVHAAIVTHAPPPIVYPHYASAATATAPPAAVVTVPQPSSVHELEQEVRRLIDGELNYRRDAEKSRQEAEKALAAHRAASAGAAVA